MLALVAAWARGASAQSLSLRAEPGYSNTTSESSTPTGPSTRTESSQFVQRYRLALDDLPYPNLRLAANGTYDWVMGWNVANGAWGRTDARRWLGSASLSLGSPVLGLSLSYVRTQASSSVSAGGTTTSSPTVVREAYSASTSWKPADLPSFTLLANHANNYDLARTSTDTTSDDVSLSTLYTPARDLMLRGSARFARALDNRTGALSRTWDEAAQVTWAGRLFADRTSVSAGYSVSNRISDTLARAGTSITTVQNAAATLSLVEAFPATPEKDTLAVNPGLSDARLDDPADTALNLGFSRSLAGDTAFRDLGARFPDLFTPVNVIQVVVTPTLPADVAAAFGFSAYRSDNNIDWVAIPLAGPVFWNELDHRFEISIARTQAQYLKVVTRPLATTVTTDPRWANVFVTELAFALVLPAEQVAGRSSQTSGTASATASTRLRPNLSHDLSVFLSHASGRPVTWAISNGLSYVRSLARTVSASGRLERRDEEQGLGHVSSNRWTAALTADPIPTYNVSVAYAGQLTQSGAGTAISNGLTLLNRADLYSGISAAASSSAGIAESELGRRTVSAGGNVGLTLTPNRVSTAAFSYDLTWSSASGGGAGDVATTSDRIDGTLTLTPVRALFAAVSVSRVRSGGQASTLANLTSSFAPFQGGSLLLRYAHTETLETSSDQRTRTTGPSARWTLRQGLYLESAFTWSKSSSPTAEATQRGLFVNLFATIL